MIFHLNNGTDRLVKVSAPTMGLAVTSITIDSNDLHQLMKMDDLQTYLGILQTRFVPTQKKEQE